ncbi:Holliday junction branch migration protein RuvA [Phycicoccus sp. BSK3Z-2]|uniref:Holliday junction branch migration complex subunit RuvA n=1 Tax=Phycicoccus avicenniae TaxID=2828860 RepID=A0A941HZP7_9MICO|nr:Holliday junction branch migration protein RuvA [Phycicoccus avicenniae]MBR7742384.1 Holliday junction branch migration protein RuvA [Phycicoccus avicenniae]
MIASVRGVVEHVGLDHVVVVVGGVGMLVHTTPATATTCHRGQEAALATSLVVREDSLTLYGFAATSERDMFETVQTVSGVGPRLALAMLSVMGPDELAAALTRGDTKALTTIPGIGAKSAQRLVLELKDKVAAIHGTPVAGAGTPPPSSSAEPWREQVTEALVGLGYTAKQAGDAVDGVAGDAPADADVATYLRLALRGLRR